MRVYGMGGWASIRWYRNRGGIASNIAIYNSVVRMRTETRQIAEDSRNSQETKIPSYPSDRRNLRFFPIPPG